MEAALHPCHRCAASLQEQSLFCPQCGAPQLVLNETDAQRVVDELTAAAAAGPLPLRPPGHERIRWRPALRIAIVVALAAGVAYALGNLAPSLDFIGFLLVLLGPTLCISFYQRKVPGARMGAGVGARIGLALGVFMSVVLTLANTASLLVMRYPRHTGAQIDQELNTQLQQRMADYAQAYPSVYANNQQAAATLHFLQSPEGHAAMMLFWGAFMACSILLYSIASGALLGWLRPMAARRRPV